MKKLLILVALLAPMGALAQPEMMCTGQDSTGATRIMATDSSGRLITSSSSGGGQQYSNGDAVTTPVGPMCMGWSGTAANALKVDSAGNLLVSQNTLIAGENLDAGYTVVHLDSTSAMAANQSVNVAQVNGVTTLMGNGVTGTGSQRVTVASDNTPFPVKLDQTTPGTTNGCSISHIAGTAVASGNGAVSAGVQRVAIASDNTSFSVGTKTTNAAVPGATNVGALVAVANVAPPTLTETYLTAASIDLKGGLRVSTASDTTGATTEVLVLNATDTAMPTTPLAGRRGLEIQNLGPNAIYCSLTAAGSPVLTKSRMIPAVSGSWSAPFGPNIVVECRAATADQATGNASVVTEWQ